MEFLGQDTLSPRGRRESRGGGCPGAGTCRKAAKTAKPPGAPQGLVKFLKCSAEVNHVNLEDTVGVGGVPYPALRFDTSPRTAARSPRQENGDHQPCVPSPEQATSPSANVTAGPGTPCPGPNAIFSPEGRLSCTVW